MEDKIYKYLSLYNKSPHFLHYLLGSIYRKIPLSLRYGKVFCDYQKLLSESKHWNNKKIAEYQWSKIINILQHAYQNVPYYHLLFKERNIRLEDIQSFEDFKKIPFLTKEIIRNNLNSLTARNFNKSKFLYVNTGGSSGVPLGLYYQKGTTRSKELAFLLEIWEQAGYKFGDKIAVLRGNVVYSLKKNKFWQYDPIKNRMILSSFHMIEENLSKYLNQIRKFKPKFLHVYPSSLSILSSYIKENKIRNLPNIKAIFSSSESLFEWQAELFKNVFNCKIIDLYGSAEAVIFAANCPFKNNYHIFPEYGYTELIDNEGHDLAEEDSIGELVGTSFDNYVMPLIRYRTDDYAIRCGDIECSCGKNYMSFKKIIGRKQEFFIDKTGSIITFTCSDDALWKIKGKISAYQYIQYNPGKVILHLEQKTVLNKTDLDAVRKDFLSFYPRFDVEIKLVKNIDRTKTGKFQYLVQKIPLKAEYIKNVEADISHIN
jgi:phenylacetate-CoA ligase